LVADYNRFARRSKPAFWGTFIGMLITNFWFLALGAMVMLGASVKQEPKEFATAIAVGIGWIALLILLADETHNAWADLYSTAVSVQNLFSKVKQRWLIIGLGVFCYIIALILDITQYQDFLYLFGSFFIPVFGVLAADYFLLRRRRYNVDAFYNPKGEYWFTGGVNVVGIVAWLIGVVAYHIANPVTLGSFFPDYPNLIPTALTTFGGSIPSFVIAFVAYAILGFVALKRSPQADTAAHRD
jgi:purine-cytosine permease-like protein